MKKKKQKLNLDLEIRKLSKALMKGTYDETAYGGDETAYGGQGCARSGCQGNSDEY